MATNTTSDCSLSSRIAHLNIAPLFCVFLLVRAVDVKVDILILSFGEIQEADMVS